MKKIMILGAGIYQVPLILKAKEMGLYTLVVSCPGPYPGFALADQCLFLDTRDAESILLSARNENIQGICTTGTDVAVRTLGYVAEKLSLPGLSFSAAQTVTDKFLMRSALKKSSVTGIPFRQVFSSKDALDFFHEVKTPVMLKAVDSSGSRGISRADSPEDVLSAYEAARETNRLPYVLAEQFIPGHEIGVDGFVNGGEIRLLLPHEKFVVTSGKTTLPGGHAFPYHAEESVLWDISRVLTQAVAATGLDNCAFNADVMIFEKKAYLLEIGGRCGATCIPELISLYCGFDYYQKILENALGLTPDFTFDRTTPCMAKLMFSPTDGSITSIDQEKLHALQAFGCRFSLDYRVGDTVEKVKNGTDRIGQVILNTERESELDSLLSRIYEAVEVDGIPLSRLWNSAH